MSFRAIFLSFFQEKLREEIILKDVTIAENSSKNVNHSFTILTPFQQEVVLAAASRKEMEEWVSAFKLAASKSKHAVSGCVCVYVKRYIFRWAQVPLKWG